MRVADGFDPVAVIRPLNDMKAVEKVERVSRHPPLRRLKRAFEIGFRKIVADIE